MAKPKTKQKAPDGAEKRRHGRLSRTFEVEVSVLAFPMPRGKSVKANCYDISEGGLSIETSHNYTVGTNVQVRINIPLLNKFSPSFLKIWENDAEQYFTAIAEVVHSDSKDGRYMVGMKYVDADPDQATALAGLINKAFRDGK